MKTLLLVSVASFAAAQTPMPVEQQTALVKQYCSSCHNDKLMTGGFSLDRFHEGAPDPGLAAMLVSKMNGGAIGADGQKPPDKITIDALVSALSAEAASADRWRVATQQGLLSASVAVTAAPSTYRLVITCRSDTHAGEMRVTWSPGDVAKEGATLSATFDGKQPRIYPIEYYKGHAILPETALPEAKLTVTNGLLGGAVTFPFDTLPRNTRKELAACFE